MKQGSKYDLHPSKSPNMSINSVSAILSPTASVGK